MLPWSRQSFKVVLAKFSSKPFSSPWCSPLASGVTQTLHANSLLTGDVPKTVNVFTVKEVWSSCPWYKSDTPASVVSTSIKKASATWWITAGKVPSPVKSHTEDECRRKPRCSGILSSFASAFEGEEDHFYRIKFHNYEQIHISIQQHKAFTKIMWPSSNLVEIRIPEVIACFFLIRLLTTW